MSEVVQVETKATNNVRLRCPLCEGLNGFWRVNFKHLQEAKGTVSRRKRCKRCQVRLLYRAAFSSESDKVVVLCHMDRKAKVDVARKFEISVEEVEEVIKSVNEGDNELQSSETA